VGFERRPPTQEVRGLTTAPLLSVINFSGSEKDCSSLEGNDTNKTKSQKITSCSERFISVFFALPLQHFDKLTASGHRFRPNGQKEEKRKKFCRKKTKLPALHLHFSLQRIS